MLSSRRIGVIAVGLLLVIGGGDGKADHPNVVVILTDDQGWGDLSLNGNTNLSTPNIDKLAAEGASFDRFYVCPVCSPTRAEFLTGRYHARGGVYSTSAGGERLNLDERTIAESFQAAGYRTAAFGKWHNGMQYPYHPNARGFDEFYGFCSGHWGHYWDPMLEHNGEIVKGRGFIIDDLTDHAIDVVKAKSNKPFFVYLPYNTPHSPMQVPDRWWQKFRDAELDMHNREPGKEKPKHVRAALAMCENIDWNVGRLLEAIDEVEEEDNTIVVYFCDNGPNGYRWNGDMKGRKGSTDEGGVRSPCIVKWPGKIAAGKKISGNAAAIDLHPTLASLASVPTVNSKPLDGIDVSGALLSEAELPKDRVIISNWKNKLSAKTGSYRMDLAGSLYDLDSDPGQRRNVAKRHPKVAHRLARAMKDFRQEVLPGYGEDNRPFVIAHPEAAVTQVPARDGIASGNIRRSNKFPNSSFFTNWIDTSDKITWTASVEAAGVYEVEIFYTCPAGQEGSTISLEYQGESVTGKVQEAHPTGLVGAEEDRFERVESYEQNWGRMTLGNIKLKRGKGELALRAMHVAAEKVMDFRLLLLRRRN